MNEIREGELLVGFPAGASARKFDGPDHGLSHCMKAVDIVIEEGDDLILLEVKDFDQTAARSRSAPAADARLERDVWAWIGKFRDSLLYLWAEERCGRHRGCYVVLECRSLDRALRMHLQELFERCLPAFSRLPRSVVNEWKRIPVHRCAVLDVKEWNRRMSRFPIRRSP